MQDTATGRLATDRLQAAAVADTLKALAHPVRLRVIAILCDGDANVSELGERLGLKQAIVSQQLRILRMGRLVDSRRQGGFVRYRLAEPRLRKLVGCFQGCPSGRAARPTRAARATQGGNNR